MKIMTMAVRNSYWNFLKSIAVSTQAEESILMKTASYQESCSQTRSKLTDTLMLLAQRNATIPKGCEVTFACANRAKLICRRSHLGHILNRFALEQ